MQLFRAGAKTSRSYLIAAILAFASCSASFEQTANTHAMPKISRIPIINVTDLYNPYQDPGDNFDLVTAYALPEIDLKAVILDVTDSFRKPVADHPVLYHDSNGPRDPGIISVEQLNYIFNRSVPYAVGPFAAMRSLDDKMLDAPAFQQQGVDLLLRTLDQSSVPITIVSFGSLRTIAVAYNRDPALFRTKVAEIHISAGTAAPDFSTPELEWNVALDPFAFVRLLHSDLPIAIYPCAGRSGWSSLDSNNSYWSLPDLQFIQQMDPKLQSYLSFAFGRVARMDFLRAMDAPLESAVATEKYKHQHNVWETAVWIAVSKRSLVQHREGAYEIIPTREIRSSDLQLKNELHPCRIRVHDDGRFVFDVISGVSNFRIYDRGDPNLNQTALREALPALYRSFKVP